MSAQASTIGTDAEAPAGPAVCAAGCALTMCLCEEALAELVSLAAIHTGGNVPEMAAKMLTRQLRPLEFEMAGAA